MINSFTKEELKDLQVAIAAIEMFNSTSQGNKEVHLRAKKIYKKLTYMIDNYLDHENE